MDFADALRSYVIALRAGGKLSTRTLENRVQSVELFQKRFPGALNTWTKDHVRLFLANPRWSAGTQLQRWKGLDSFFNFCLEEGILRDSPLTGVKRPKEGKARRPPKFTDEDIDVLLSVCTRWTWLGLRDQALIMTLWTTPFRLSEIAGLRVADVDFHNFTVRTIHGKGGVEYTAVLFPNCARALDRYLQKRPHQGAEALWLTDDGKPMSGHALQQMLRRLEKKAKEAGFTKHLYAHAFRHNYGMRTVQWGLALDETARSMGQRSEAAAKIYRQWSLEEQALAKIRRIAG